MLITEDQFIVVVVGNLDKHTLPRLHLHAAQCIPILHAADITFQETLAEGYGVNLTVLLSLDTHKLDVTFSNK